MYKKLLFVLLFLTQIGLGQVIVARRAQYTSAPPPAPTLIQWVSSSSTVANATNGSTVNSCPNHAYCFILPNGTQSANAIVGAVQFNNTPSSTPTVTDDGSN